MIKISDNEAKTPILVFFNKFIILCVLNWILNTTTINNTNCSLVLFSFNSNFRFHFSNYPIGTNHELSSSAIKSILLILLI